MYWKMYTEVLSAVLFCCLLSVNSYKLNGELPGTELAEAENNEPVEKRDLSLMGFMTDVLDRLDELQKQIDTLAGKNTLEVCPDGWYKYGKSCYYFSNNYANWFESLSFCHILKGYLAEINSHSENTYLKGKTNYLDDRFWVGGTDLIKENHWMWVVDQTKITTSLFTGWHRTQPDNSAGNEHCMEITEERWWNDVDCRATRKYICERNLK